MKGYAAGVLLSEKESPFEKALTPVQCLHYCLTRPAVVSVMAGVSNRNQILAATAYSTSSNKEKDYSEVLANAPRSSFSGHCMYCGHCAPCSKKIDIASVNKYLDLALKLFTFHHIQLPISSLCKSMAFKASFSKYFLYFI